jgi:hypothetical protein
VFRVHKINRHGHKQARIILIDEKNAQFRMYNSKLHLLKSIPLVTLTSIVRCAIDNKSLELVFSSEHFSMVSLRFANAADCLEFGDLAQVGAQKAYMA